MNERPPHPQPDAAATVIETDDGRFEADVDRRSEEGLVLVDFWAEWCAPCRALGPVLEKLASEPDCGFTLVKANTDQTPAAATRFGVSGIPAVFAVLNGRIIDGFQGAMPEAEIRQWLDKMRPMMEFVAARQRIADDPADAERRLKKLLDEAPDHEQAMIVLAELFLGQDRDDECRQMLEKLEERGFLEPEAERIKAALDLKGKADTDVAAVRQAAEQAPEDLQKQLDLAEALLGHQDYAEAFDICLALVERDRHGAGERARELMVEAFRVLPEDSELTGEYRRRLSMLLF